MSYGMPPGTNIMWKTGKLSKCWLNGHYSFSRKKQKIKHSLQKVITLRTRRGVLSGHRSAVFRFTPGSVLWQQKDMNESVLKIVLLKSEFCYYLGSGKFEVEFPGKNKQWHFFILVTKCQLFCLRWRVTHCQSLTSRDEEQSGCI